MGCRVLYAMALFFIKRTVKKQAFEKPAFFYSQSIYSSIYSTYSL